MTIPPSPDTAQTDDRGAALLPDTFGETDATSSEREETLLERMGGWSGLIYSTLPVLVFVPLNAWQGLPAAIWASLAVAFAIFLVRLIRRDKLTPAVSGFLAVALCAYIAYRMGDAKGYFVWGIWVSAAYALLSIMSMMARWPIVGVCWSALNGLSQDWRQNTTARRWYSLATFAWALVFAARFVVQQWLYVGEAATALGVARILMGWPLTIIAVVVTVWAVRKASAATPGTPLPHSA